MAEICEMQNIFVLNSGMAKGMPGRARTLPNAYSALPPSLQKDRGTLIKQSNILLNNICCIVVLSLTQ